VGYRSRALEAKHTSSYPADGEGYFIYCGTRVYSIEGMSGRSVLGKEGRFILGKDKAADENGFFSPRKHMVNCNVRKEFNQ
jgi:hypothetical protein